MKLGNFFNFFSSNKETNVENNTPKEIDYDQLIKDMKLAKRMNDTIRQEIFQKAEDFEKSMKELKKKSRK